MEKNGQTCEDSAANKQYNIEKLNIYTIKKNMYIYIKWSDIFGLRVTSESSHFDYGPIHQLKHTGTIVPADETDLNI